MATEVKSKIGLLAGWGRYPVVLAERLRDLGHEVYGLGVKDQADPALAGLCREFAWLGLAKVGFAIRYFRRHGIQHAVMAGKYHKVLLFQPWRWLKHLPDWYAIKTFHQHFLTSRKDCQDDTLLGTVVEAFASEGITFHPATDFVPEILVKAGQLTRRGPSAAAWKDVAYGWRLAKELGRLDVGQSVAVKGQVALAVEAIEGTDHCLRRAGQLCPAGGFSIVKVAKPEQDMRFDVPTIGVGTLQTMLAAGARVLAIEAGRTIILDEAKTLDFADRHALTIVAVDSAEMAARQQAA